LEQNEAASIFGSAAQAPEICGKSICKRQVRNIHAARKAKMSEKPHKT
jgi:hypothetical protein